MNKVSLVASALLLMNLCALTGLGAYHATIWVVGGAERGQPGVTDARIDMLMRLKRESIERCRKEGGSPAMGFESVVCVSRTGWSWEQPVR